MPFASPGQTIVTRGKRRVVVGASGPSIPTYAEYQAAVFSVFPLNQSATNPANNSSNININVAPPSGTMNGSSWSSAFDGLSAWDRVVQHGFPTLLSYTNMLARGGYVGVKISTASPIAGFVAGVLRWGYLSNGVTDPANSLIMMTYYDDVLGPMKVNPRFGLGPIPWDMISTVY